MKGAKERYKERDGGREGGGGVGKKTRRTVAHVRYALTFTCTRHI